MRPMRVEVGRLRLSLDGVAESTVEEAMQGLDAELRSRLMRARTGGYRETPVEVDRVTITATADRLDADSLRTMIVERLAEQIERAAREPEKR